ncbi:RidA family protein, partial [Psychrobacter sp. T6-1]|uniref:RidA family protein n=1 Tax=Psychrobacter sp. T6-1 TaxID=3457447 RepID=UPI003FD6238A
MLSNTSFKVLSKAIIISACSLSFVLTAQAAPAATMSKTAPVFLGDGGDYPFSSAVRVGDTLYMSGQIGFKDGQLVKGGIKAETKQAL